MNITTIVDYELTTEEAAILSAYLHETARQACREITQANQTAVGKGRTSDALCGLPEIKGRVL